MPEAVYTIRTESASNPRCIVCGKAADIHSFGWWTWKGREGRICSACDYAVGQNLLNGRSFDHGIEYHEPAD